MAKKSNSTWLVDEVADFLTRSPSRAELLAFRPSPRVQERYAALIAKAKVGTLGAGEKWELNQFEHIEMLIQAIKAKVRPRCKVRS